MTLFNTLYIDLYCKCRCGDVKALESLQQYSSSGDNLATGFLAVVLHVNLLMILPRDKPRARSLLKKTLPWLLQREKENISSDIAHVWFLLGQWEDFQEKEVKDSAKAVHYFRLAAETGHILGQTAMGLHYKHGDGVVKNLVTAFEFYSSAAKQGYPVAQCVLGCMYNEGQGCTRNRYEANKLQVLAAEKGYVGGLFNLGVYHDSSDYWSRGAELGDRNCIRKIAKCYLHGRSRRYDSSEAFRFMLAAANLGDYASIIDVANFYRSGIGVNANMIEAVRYVSRALKLATCQSDVDKLAEKKNTWKCSKKYLSEVIFDINIVIFFCCLLSITVNSLSLKPALMYNIKNVYTMKCTTGMDGAQGFSHVSGSLSIPLRALSMLYFTY